MSDPFPPPVCEQHDTYYPCKGELYYGPDPFAYEIYDDDTPIWLCALHADMSADEI